MSEKDGTSKSAEHQTWNDPKLTTGLSGPGRVESGPGKLVMKASMELHTRLAVNMFRGRRSDPAKGIHAIQGLLGFAQKLSTIWTGAANDDPIADMYLIKVEEAYDRASALLNATLAVIKELLSDMEGFSIEVSESDKPATVEMQFLTPWSWRAAELLRRYDELIRMCLTARHLGVLSQEDWQQTVRKVGNAIRHLFKVPDEYLFTGLRRFRMGGRIKRARSMYAKRGMEMPVIPEEVLTLKRRSRFAPPIKPYIEADKKEKLKAFQRKQGSRVSRNGTTPNAGDVLGSASAASDAAALAAEVPGAEVEAEAVEKMMNTLVASDSEAGVAKITEAQWVFNIPTSMKPEIGGRKL